MPLDLDSGEIHEQDCVLTMDNDASIFPHKLPAGIDKLGILSGRKPLTLKFVNQANTFFALSSKFIRSSADWQ